MTKQRYLLPSFLFWITVIAFYSLAWGCDTSVGPKPETIVQTIYLDPADDFSFVVGNPHWVNDNPIDATAFIEVAFAVGYRGDGSTAQLIFETLLFQPDSLFNIGVVLEIMATTIDPPGGVWEDREISWGHFHRTARAYWVNDPVGYWLMHRILEIRGPDLVLRRSIEPYKIRISQ